VLKKYIILIFAIIIYPNEKSSLEIQNEIDSRSRQIDLLKQEIEQLEENIIAKTKKQINISEILLDLENKINLTEQLIISMNKEEKTIQRKIDKIYIEITNKEQQIKKIQDELKNNMIHAYKNGKPTFLESILNIDDLYDITYKTKYLKTVNIFQRNNKEKLNNLILDLKSENEKLKERLENKKKIIKNKKEESQKLKNDITKKNELLEKINSDKKDQKSRLTNKKRALEEIEELINKLYADKKSQEKREQQLAEIRKMQKMVTNGNFNSMKGKLPWPINGAVISKFGNKKNQKLKTITENLGINIKSSSSTQVIAVLDGVVSTITYIRGHGNIIILDHGDGFNTVYSNIENILINENDYVKAGQNIAAVGDNMTLHFEIWGNQKKMNPEKWLIKK